MIKSRTIIFTLAITVGLFGVASHANAMTINSPQSKSFQQNKGLNSGLVGWWTFDGADMSGSSILDKTAQGNTGTKTVAVKSTVGKIGQGLRFPGTLTDYVSIPDSSSLSPGNGSFAVSLWFKFIAKGDKYLGGDYGAYLYNDYGSVSNNLVNIVLQTDVDNKILATYRDGSGNSLLISGVGNVLTDQKWHHVAWIKNNKTGILYTDGQLVSSVTNNSIGTITTSDANPIILGRYATAGLGGFNGYMDDVRIYNRALSAQEVKQLYAQGAGTKINQPQSKSYQQGKGVNSGLVGWWTMDGADITATTALDKSGNNNTGTITGGVTKVPGKVGQGMKFDGSTGYLLNHSANFPFLKTTSFSGSAWVKTSLTSDQVFFSNWHLAIAPGWEFSCTSQKILFFLTDAFGGNYEGEQGSTLVTDGKWHFISFTYNGSNTAAGVKLYVDGKAETLTPWIFGTQDPGVLVNDSFEIGRRNYNTAPINFSGSMDDVRIYNRVLSAQEVQKIYIQSVGTKINQPPSESSLQGKGINSGLLGWWTFDGADVSGTNVLDKSGQNNTGAKVAGVQNVSGKIGQALKFDGNTGSEISVSPATSINPTQATTFSAWIKTTDGEGTIVSKDDIGTNRQFAFIVSTGRAEFYVFQNSGLYSTAGAAAVIVNDGRWHHVVGTIDVNMDGKVRIYVDGTLSDTAAVSIASIASTSRPIYIGDRENVALPLAGLIDDVRIYNRALSLAEIKQLYAMGK